MKIVKYGKVIVEKDTIKVEGWLCEPEASDPVGATGNEMVLATVIPWARKRFDDEVNKAIIQAKVAQMRRGN